jgi:hypothetical protein
MTFIRLICSWTLPMFARSIKKCGNGLRQRTDHTGKVGGLWLMLVSLRRIAQAIIQVRGRALRPDAHSHLRAVVESIFMARRAGI